MESFPYYVYEDEDFPEVEIDINSIEPKGSEDESDSDSDFDVNTNRKSWSFFFVIADNANFSTLCDSMCFEDSVYIYQTCCCLFTKYVYFLFYPQV